MRMNNHTQIKETTMNIKNLSQLKKAVESGKSFIILEHYIKPELSGQKRKPTKIQTNGFYSIVPDEPDNPINAANGGRGYWFEYGKASAWTFENGVCTNHFANGKVWDIQFID